MSVADCRRPCKQHIPPFHKTATHLPDLCCTVTVWLGIGMKKTWLGLEMLGLALHKAQLSSVYETLKGSFRLNLAINNNS